MLTFVLLVFVLVVSITVASFEIEIIAEDTYKNAEVIVVYGAIGSKMCGRQCHYQDQCSAINYNPATLVCELLETGGRSESVSGSLHFPISGLTMEMDHCHPNPCTGRLRCLKTISGYFCQTFTTPCDLVICQHGGTCKNGLFSFECLCTNGSFGTLCEIERVTSVSITATEYENESNILYGPYDVGKGYRALIRFTRMDVEEIYDSVKIYDGQFLTDTLLAERSGTSLGSDIITGGQFVLIQWITDHSITQTGFEIQIYKSE